MKNKINKKLGTGAADKRRILVVGFLTVIVFASLILYAVKNFVNGIDYSILPGIILAAIIMLFFFIFVMRRAKDVSRGMPFEDERSKRVIEKASSTSFYVTLYLLLAIGMLSEDLIKFRDVSQATGVAVGGMAILFFIFWVYFNKREI